MIAIPQLRTKTLRQRSFSVCGIAHHSTAVKITILAALCLIPLSCLSQAQEKITPDRQELTPAQQKAADLRLPEVDRSELLPERRTPTDVPANERNPFGSIALPPPEEKEVTPIEMETEEMKLRRILGNLRVSGVSGSPDTGYTVLLGPLVLRAGTTLPRLFENQAEILRIESVTDHDAVFAFVEKDTTLPPRTIGINFNLHPHVRSLLAGELLKNIASFDKKGGMDAKPLKMESAEAIAKALDKQNLESLVERRFEMMGEAIPSPQTNEPNKEK